MIDFIIFGIKFRVSLGFLGLICLMLYIDKSGLILPVIFAVILHEAGHLLALLLLKCKPERVELKVGAVGILGKFPLKPKGEFIMFLSGSSVNIFCFSVLYIIYCFSKNPQILNYSLVMLVVGVMNLLPVIGLDGGSLIKIFLSSFLKISTAKRITVVFSIVTSIAITVLGINIFLNTKTNPSLVLLGIYLFLKILILKKS